MVQASRTADIAEAHRQVAFRLSELADSHPEAAELRAVAARFGGPPRVVVSGRAGSGRRTLRWALAERLGCVTDGVEPDDADIAVHLLVAPPRDADRRAIERLPAGRSLLVLGKVDVVDPPAVDGLGPVVRRAAPLLATLRPTEDDVRLLSALVDSGVRQPLTAAAVVGATSAETSGAATELARRFGRSGMHVGLAAVAESPGITAAELEALMVDRSGVAELLEPIRDLAQAAVPQRLSRVARELDRLAAGGVARDELECLLAGELRAIDRRVSPG
ncbi:hypothetical protein [Jongsikchunia kroppenstedtii]|uniref:hypothetical protein n=1 Tax=Jongsikchunia kroppenstedtii TaxID=1121721 RepID=UPI00037E3B96|nr:hypothetical protein [Jongsikchunia kroppenstedtii]